MLTGLRILCAGILLCSVASCSAITRDGAQTSGPLSGTGGSGVALAFQADTKFAKFLGSEGRRKVTQAEFSALNNADAGMRVEWKDQTKQASGWVEAFQLFKVGQKRCRRFQHEARAKDVRQEVRATACRIPGGDWQLVE